MCVCECVCVGAHGDQRSALDIILQKLSALAFWDLFTSLRLAGLSPPLLSSSPALDLLGQLELNSSPSAYICSKYFTKPSLQLPDCLFSEP